MIFDTNTRPDLKLMAVMAAASSDAYDEDSQCDAELAEAGLTGIAHVDQPAAHAVLADMIWNGAPVQIVDTRGTEFTQAIRATRESLSARLEAIKSCYANVDQTKAPFPTGGYVPRGYFEGARTIFDALRPKLALNRPVIFTGHSQGAVCGLLEAALAKFAGFDASFYVFAPPKPGDDDFAASIADVPGFAFERWRDFATTHDVFTGWTVKPRPYWWLHDGTMTLTTGRPGINESVEDHDDQKYKADTAAFAEKGWPSEGEQQ